MTIKRILFPKYIRIRDTYTIDSILGEGAFGSVYRVRHKFLGMQALKIFHPGSIPLEQEPELFNEAYILSKITHENVVRVYEANTFEYEGNKYCYIAMEYIKGGTLSNYIEKQVRLPIDTAIDIQRGICGGLAQLHKLEPPLIHRDVKPQNVMINMAVNGIMAKISDFGLTKQVDPMTRMADAAGTLAYLPPEGFWNYETPASDVFSAGIIFYLMLTGVPPFKMPAELKDTKKDEIRTTIIASRNKKPEPPSKFNLDLDDEISDIVLKALDPEIKKRYQDAEKFLNAIDQYQQKRNSLSDENVKKALKMGKQYVNLKIAIDLLEKAIAQCPGDKQRELKEKYNKTLDNWKKGVVM
jgi:serine/threonine-protein kinase